jgi:hypothetical protein
VKDEVTIPASHLSEDIFAEFFISTKAIPFTPLQASHKLPLGVCTMFRTTPPPDGMIQVWNFSVLGSNRTTVFGLVFDSLYQMMSPTAVMP